MSHSVRPHRWQPTRFPRPWDSPGKNSGVGCHFLLQCMKVKSESEVAQSCLTLSDPMDCSLPGSSIHGIFQARVLEWGATRFTQSHRCRFSNRDTFKTWTPREERGFSGWVPASASPRQCAQDFMVQTPPFLLPLHFTLPLTGVGCGQAA